ncbi:MAG: CocE/NonD family hydrolase [Firmicutes bacterium]|nr:CocE/NonD family hydrolase [Alicyclobacillaceae bacterium]MCL6496158.1 CocE/NonD family hydrolase [Bacillota bacterium]
MAEFTYRFRAPIAPPEAGGIGMPAYRQTVADGMRIERDVAVPLRDGTRIYIDLFRPVDESNPVPVLIGWSPYGKHARIQYDVFFPGSEVNPDHVSSYAAFEGPDPLYWVPRGYAVINADIRGVWNSEGKATFFSPEEAQDFYDLIEWAGTQPWSNGKVGLTGVSYLAVMQWRVAELHPPHLAAINPWEGWTDTYREVATHGGIPDSWFWPFLQTQMTFGRFEVEDLVAETQAHPFFDAFWESKAAALERVTVPAYVVASFSDQGLHLRGTLEGFKRIASPQKWLEVHRRKKWAYYYQPESKERLKWFFDHFLKGESDAVLSWPRVRYELAHRFYVGTWREARDWPLPETRYIKFYLDTARGTLDTAPAPTTSHAVYHSLGGGPGPHRATFDWVFTEPTDVVGHMAVRLYMAAEEGEDLDVFVAIWKLDREGQVVPFPYYAQFNDGPVALGWIRASHRELDPERSTEFQPVLAHRRALPVRPGEIVPLDIEIWPSATHFDAGEGLRLVVQGTDVNKYPKPAVYCRHEESVNRGLHRVYTGGPYPAYLLLPIVSA